MLTKGYVQLYTGNGKGKTTAAIGQALRAAGAGLKVIIIQFLKKEEYNEFNQLKKIKEITIEQYGAKSFYAINDDNYEEHYSIAKNGIKRAYELLENNKFDLIILDEIVTTLSYNILTLDEIVKLIEIKPENKELILTGKGAPQHLIALCDLVTEMVEVKHYANQGVEPREGIDR